MNGTVWGTRNGRPVMSLDATHRNKPQVTAFAGDLFLHADILGTDKETVQDLVYLSRALLQVEALGVLSRRIIPICAVDTHIPDRYIALGYVPPRLVYALDTKSLYHVFGDDTFYDKFPEYTPGGRSCEAVIINEEWLSISNYLLQEEAYISRYGDDFVLSLQDKLLQSTQEETHAIYVADNIAKV